MEASVRQAECPLAERVVEGRQVLQIAAKPWVQPVRWRMGSIYARECRGHGTRKDAL
jgi:hypothetical protein